VGTLSRRSCAKLSAVSSSACGPQVARAPERWTTGAKARAAASAARSSVESQREGFDLVHAMMVALPRNQSVQVQPRCPDRGEAGRRQQRGGQGPRSRKQQQCRFGPSETAKPRIAGDVASEGNPRTEADARRQATPRNKGPTEGQAAGKSRKRNASPPSWSSRPGGLSRPSPGYR